MRNHMVLTCFNVHQLIFDREIQSVNDRGGVFSFHPHIKTVITLCSAKFTDVPVEISAFLYDGLFTADTDCPVPEILDLVQYQMGISPDGAIKLSGEKVFSIYSPGVEIDRHHSGCIVIDDDKNFQQGSAGGIGKFKVQQKFAFLAHPAGNKENNAFLCQRPEPSGKGIRCIIFR